MRRARGFTLLEVVVALAIMSLGVTAALSVFSGGLKNIRRIDMAQRAMVHAENVMNELLVDESLRDPRHLSGDLDADFSYTATVDYWQEPRERVSLDMVQPTAYMLSLDVEIHFKNDRYGKKYRAVCLKTVPEDTILENPASPGDAIRRLFGGGNR
jgi:general secretion pathway protein I